MHIDVRYCDICGCPLHPNVLTFIHWGYLYCPSCEITHRQNQEKEKALRDRGL